MATFESFDDLFSFNRCLMEDDWNDGQFLTVKDKRTANGFDITSTAKVAEASGGKQKFVLEQKAKGHLKDFGGHDVEFKLKNSGLAQWEFKHHVLGQFDEALKPAKLHCKGDVNNGTFTNMWSGIDFCNDRLKVRNLFTYSWSPKIEAHATYRCSCDRFTFGAKFEGAALEPAKQSKLALAVAGHFEKKMQYGIGWNTNIADKKLSGNVYNFYLNNQINQSTVGVHMEYNQDAKKWTSKLGYQHKLDDHTWRMRFHDNGLMKLALHWQLHKVCKASVNTYANLKDLANGSVDTLPFNFGLEVKY